MSAYPETCSRLRRFAMFRNNFRSSSLHDSGTFRNIHNVRVGALRCREGGRTSALASVPVAFGGLLLAEMAAPVDQKTAATDALQAAARGLSLRTRITSAGVLNTLLDHTVAFSTLNSWNEACRETARVCAVPIEDNLVSESGEFLIATRIGFKRPREREEQKHEQRELDDVQRKVLTLLRKLSSSAPKDTIKTDELKVAQTVLECSLGGMMGPGGAAEKVVQSFGLFQKKLASTDPRPRIVVALRLNAGVPIKLSILKRCMSSCWADGALTTSDAVSGVDSVQLPLTEEGELSKSLGNAPILLVTSVPVEK